MVEKQKHKTRKISVVEGGGVYATIPTGELTITKAMDIVRSEKYKDILTPIRAEKDKEK